MIALEQARQHLETLGLKQAVKVLDHTLDSAASKQLLSMAPRKWATGAEEWCTTGMKADGSKTGRVATLQEWENTALTVRPIVRRGRPEFERRRSSGCA